MTAERPRYLTTGDLARKSGATQRAIRFYEQSGLLAPRAREAGGRRQYTTHDLERLQLIHDLRDLDLSIDDIKQLLTLRDDCESAPDLGHRLSQAVTTQLERAHRRLAALHRLLDELSATLNVIKACTTCDRELAGHPCKGCSHVTAPETPRIVKVLLGQCWPTPGERRSAEPTLVPLKACADADDPAQEP